MFSFGGMRSIIFGSASTFQPLGAEPDSSTASAAAVPVLATIDRDRGFLPGRGAGVEPALAAGELDLRRAGDLETQFGGDGGVLGGRARRDLLRADADRVRRTDLELDVLRLAGVERHGVEFLAAVLLGEGDFEIRRRGRGEVRDDALAALVLDRELILEGRARVAAQLRQRRRQRQLGRQILHQRDGDRQRDGAGALGGDGEIGRAHRRILGDVEAKLERDAGVGRRQHRLDRLAAADDGRGPALRHARHRNLQALGRHGVVLQAQADRRGRAWADADGRIIGQQEQPFDVRLRRCPATPPDHRRSTQKRRAKSGR